MVYKGISFEEALHEEIEEVSSTQVVAWGKVFKNKSEACKIKGVSCKEVDYWIKQGFSLEDAVNKAAEEANKKLLEDTFFNTKLALYCN